MSEGGRRFWSIQWIRYGVLLLLCLSIIWSTFLIYRTVYGATYTWDGGGTSNDWSDCDNWTSNTCPGASDLARFDGTSVKDAVVDASFAGSVLGVDINAGYTGTVTQARNLTIGTSGFDQAAGTWQQITYTFDINAGSFVLSAGTFTAATGTNTVSRDFTKSGGTLSASSTRVFTIDGGNAESSTLTCTGELGVLVHFDKLESNNFTTIGAGCIATSSATTITRAGATFTINGELNTTGNVDLGNSDLTINGTLRLGGTTFALDRNFTQNGTFVPGDTTTVVFSGDNADYSTLTCTGDFETLVNFDKVESNNEMTIASGCNATTSAGFTRAGVNLRINGTLYIDGNVDLNVTSIINNGTLRLGGTTFVIDRSFTQNGTFDPGSTAAIEFDGENADSSTIFCSGEFEVPVFFTKINSNNTISIGSGCSVTLSASGSGQPPTTINGTLSLAGYNYSASSLSIASAGRLRLFGNESITSPSISENATIEYYGASTYTTLGAGYDYENVEFSNGTYTISTAMTVEDDFTNSGATFTHTGDFTLDGGDQTITGSSTFANFTKEETSTTTLTFEASSKQTITDQTTLTGVTGGNLVLESSAPGSEYFIDFQGFREASYLTVSDLNNVNVSTLYCDPGCHDATGNTNITFSANPDGSKIYWDGGGGDENWSTCENWAFDTCPSTDAEVAFDDRSTKNVTIDSAPLTLTSLSIESGYTGTITDSYGITAVNYAQSDGTYVAEETFTITNFSQPGGTFTASGNTVRTYGEGTLAPAGATSFNNLSIGFDAPDDNLLVYYKLDEAVANSTVIDTSVNGYDGTPTGSGGVNNYPQPTTDRPNGISFTNDYALDFDGSNDAVDLAYQSGFNSSNDLSISFWVELDAVGTLDGLITRRILNSSLLWSVAVNSSRYLIFYTSTNGSDFPNITSTIPLSLSTWYHIAVTNDADGGSSGKKIYINGVQRGSGSGTSIYDATTDITTLGRDPCCGDRFFDGRLDDVRIYNRVLSSDEVAVLAAGERRYIDTLPATTTLASSTLTTNGEVLIDVGSVLDVSATGCSGLSCTLSIGGDFTNNGTFVPRTGTVSLTGTSQTLTGSTTFYNLSKLASASSTLFFEANSEQNITHQLTFTGSTVNNRLNLRSTSPDTQWKIIIPGNNSISTVSVRDSNNSGSVVEVSRADSVDLGNNTGWTFLPPREIYRIDGGVRFNGGVRF